MSFRLKTILGIALIQAILLAVLIATALGELHRAGEWEVRQRAATAGRLLEAATQNAVVATDLAQLDALLAEVAANPDLVYARVLDARGRLLAAGGEPAALARPFRGDSHLEQAEADGVFDSAVEIRIGGQLHGRIELGLDVQSLRHSLDDTLRSSLLVAALGMGLVALFSLGLGTLLTRRLRSLKEASEAITQGSLGHQIPVSGSDEIAATIRAFNTMSERLREDEARRNAILAERQAAEEQLRNLSRAVEQQSASVVITDARGTIEYVNAAFEQVTGYTRAEALGQNPRVLKSGRMDPAIYRELWRTIAAGEVWIGELINRKRSGELYVEAVSIAPVRDGEGRITHYVAVKEDVTARKEMERQLREERDFSRRAEQAVIEERAFLQAVIDGVGDPVMVLGPDYRLLHANAAARAQLADPDRDLAALHCYEVSHGRATPCAGENHVCPLSAVQASRAPVRVVHEHLRSDDSPRSYELIATPLWHRDGSLRAVIESSRDVTEHLKLLDELRDQRSHMQHLAQHDPLTGLPNRLLFADRLEQAIRKAIRHHSGFALLFVDLDRFKHINDSLGHAAGDEVLMEAARRLGREVRASDTVARVGGDEFVVIANGITDAEQAGVLAQKVLAEMAAPVQVAGRELYLTTSIGVCLYPQDGGSGELLLRNADAAMYRAKESGRNGFQFYSAEMTEQAYRRVLLESSLRTAIEQGQLTLVYQPQYALEDGRLVGLEALVRWQHPERGVVGPDSFIPVAEETGMVIEIGRFVLRSACRQLMAWRNAGFEPGRMAVNLSGRELQDPELAAGIRALLEETGCPPRLLELEVTETMVMREIETTLGTLRELRELGVQVAVDDFGTGYSSLNYLKLLPIHKLKIDRSFVRGIPEDANDVAIVTAIVALARSLGLTVIAEGVESETQQAFLRGVGCDEAQGYLLARPLPPAQITALLPAAEATALPPPAAQAP